MKKRLGALIMAFTMILGIFSGIRVDMVWADEGGQDGNDAAVTGLAVAYLFDWDEDNKPSLREDAVWEKETETGLGECILYAKKLSDAGEPEGDPIRADELTLVYCGADGADTPQEGIGTVTALEADGDYLSLQVTKLGVYQLYVTDHADDVVTIKAAYRNFEFCTSQTLNEDGILNHYDLTDADNRLYLIESAPKEVTWDKTDIWNVSVDGKPVDEADYGTYFSRTKVADDENSVTYEITFVKGSFHWIDMEVSGNGTYSDDGPWDTSIWLSVNYDGIIPGFGAAADIVWSEDGIPSVVEGGVYATEQWAYLSQSMELDFADVDADGIVTKSYSADELTATAIDGNGTATISRTKGTPVSVSFDKLGDYRIAPADGSSEGVVIHVSYCPLGVYTENMRSEETAWHSNKVLYSSNNEDTILYVIPTDDKAMTIGNVRFLVQPVDEEETDDIADYYSVTEIGDGSYKLVINGSNRKNFNLEIKADVSDGENSWEFFYEIWREYIQEDKLLVTDYIDFTEDGTPSLNSEAALLTYTGARVTGEHYTLYLALCDSSNKEKAAVSAEQLVMRDEAGNETGTITANKKNSRFVDVTFPKEGSYTLALRSDENNRVWVIAGYPELSFYTDNTISKEAYVENLRVSKADSDRKVLYMLQRVMDEVTIKNLKLQAVVYDAATDKTTYFDAGTYFTYENISTIEGVARYKITLAERTALPEKFWLRVTGILCGEGEEIKLEEAVEITVEQGESVTPAPTPTPTPAPTPTPTPTPTPAETTETDNTTKDTTTTEVKKETVKNDSGKKVTVETTVVKNEAGKVLSSTTISEIPKAAKNTTATVTVKKNAKGKTTSAEAVIENTVKKGKKDTVKTTISAKVVKQVSEAADSTKLNITQTVKDTKGKVLYTVETNAKNLVAGKKLTLVKIVDGKQILVTKPVTVSKSGNVSVNAGTGEYKLLSASEAKALQKQILKTVKPEQKELAVEKGEKAKVKLSSKLDMNNVASVTYNCSDTSIAKVDKNGKVTTKKKGTATITMTVTLNDGSTKRIATTITVK